MCEHVYICMCVRLCVHVCLCVHACMCLFTSLSMPLGFRAERGQLSRISLVAHVHVGSRFLDSS